MHRNGFRCGIAAAALGLVALAGAQPKISNVEIVRLGKGVEVRIRGEGLKSPVLSRAFGGRSLILDFNATLDGKAKREAVQVAGLDFVHASQFQASPPKVRVHLRFLAPNSTITPIAKGSMWIVRMGDTTSPIAMAAAPKAGPPTRPPKKDDLTIERAKADRLPKTVAKSGGSGSVKMPPIRPPKPVASNQASSQASNQATEAATREVQVTLDFTNTELVQIFRALALQAGVNIVTSPDVKGKLTISLDRMSVREALDLITALAGLRWGQIGRTYLVTTADKFADTMAQFGGIGEERSETRVVPIFSGEGVQLKAAILKSMPPGSGAGRYEITLPSEQITLEQTTRVGASPAAVGSQPSGGASGGGGTTMETRTADRPKRDEYVVLIGPAKQLDTVQAAVERLDRQMCEALGIRLPRSGDIIQRVYEVKGGDAEALRKALVGDRADRLGNVEITATPSASRSKPVISIKGRENEVDRVMQTLQQLDASDEGGGEFTIYEVKYADPRSLREEIINAVPGLRASIPPASAGNPRLFQPGEATRAASEQVQPGPQGGGAAGGGGAAVVPESGVRSEGTGPLLNLSQPFRDVERVAVPMRLILRGSAEQLAAARKFLEVVDVPPKQVALELRVMELSKEDAIQAGIDWNIFTGGAVRILRLNNSQPSTPGPNNRIGVKMRDGDVTASLDKIANKNNLIARPNMLATDGRESELFVGEVIRYIVSITSGQNGPNVQTGELPIGVRLAVLPRIGADGSLTMDLRPRVSALRGFTDVPNGGRLPQTTERIAQSTVTVQDGETIAIGGLIQDQDRREVTGVPILMDFPLIGQLFRKTTTSRTRTEVVLFLTVKTVDGPARADNIQLPVEKDMTKEAPKKNGGKQ
ncbi:MAG TPA: hypothetical protein PLH94_03425 [Fimbriimonadaceae bacterium]|nr:hypothetical protein [Fimbriimonadaceae bacterium]